MQPLKLLAEPFRKVIADTFSWTVENPILWSAEDPQLYDLIMEVFDENGILQEVIPQKVASADLK